MSGPRDIQQLQRLQPISLKKYEPNFSFIHLSTLPLLCLCLFGTTWPEKRLHCNLAFLKATWTQKKTPVNVLVQTSVLTSSFSQGNLLAVLLQSALMALFHKLKAKIDRSHQYFFSGSRKIFAERFSVNRLERPEATFRCLAAASWFVTIKISLCWIGALGLL